MKKILLFVAVLFASNLSRAQWEPDVRLTNALYGSYTSYNNAWCIASSGDSVHVVWYDERDGNQELYYKRSTDGGLSWGEDVRLTNDIAETWEASIAVSGSVVHIVWDECRDGDGEIYYKRSTDGGTIWGPDTRLTDAIEWSEFPSLAISGLDLHAVWVDSRDGSYAIYYKRSADGGLSWQPDTRLSYGSAYCFFPSVAASGSVVHVLWEDERDGNGEIYYRRSTDGGISWGLETRITNNAAGSWDPSVSLYGSVVHVAWMDSRAGGGYEVYYKRSDDEGLTWGEDTRLTYATGDSRYPNISVSGSFVHIVWQDKRDVNEEIYYKQSTDGGISWEEDLRLTNANYASQYASVASSGSVVHVVWYDNRDMNEEIYYKRNPTGNIFVGTENDLSGNSEQQIYIYPNPASRQLAVGRLDGWAVGQLVVRLSIVDLYGREIKEFQDISSFPYTVDISGLRNGLYILRVINEEGNTGSVMFLKIAD
jgi:hypothetical protein